jgi:hypothetical protein
VGTPGLPDAAALPETEERRRIHGIHGLEFELWRPSSIGVTDPEIFGQFLIESVSLSRVGGAIGLTARVYPALRASRLTPVDAIRV